MRFLKIFVSLLPALLQLFSKGRTDSMVKVDSTDVWADLNYNFKIDWMSSGDDVIGYLTPKTPGARAQARSELSKSRGEVP